MNIRRTDAATGSASAFRTERLFCVNGQWFFSTRESGDQGPFNTRMDALSALAAFVEEVVALDHIRASMSASRQQPAELHDGPDLESLFGPSAGQDDDDQLPGGGGKDSQMSRGHTKAPRRESLASGSFSVLGLL